ncbi:hypothetical protein V9T40_008184 [Parthenolecanium corni]|uniref:RNA-directed DNA polymerase n=1 Tax=Parthenolecanium corni TaxID=536013 RepID=A0AAN9TP11_9HEMI
MPFRLKNAPATFQRIVNQSLSGLIGNECFVYLDDIAIFSSNFEDHIKRLRNVLQRLKTNGFVIQPDKCEFLKSEICYLGHVISSAGIRPNPAKVVVIKNLKPPTNVNGIQQFLGFVTYYRKFVTNFPALTKPIFSLLKKDAKFIWDQNCQESFQKIINALTPDLLLIYPDFEKTYFWKTDASDYAIVSVLQQETEKGILKPIAYASRTLNKAELNYSTIEKELLAIVWSVKHFRPYLCGRKLTILSDHKPLQWLFNVNDPGSRLPRWRLKLAEQSYEIQHIPDEKQKIKIEPEIHNILKSVKLYWIFWGKISDDRNELIQQFHEHKLSGHQGVTKCYHAILQKGYYWKGMKKVIIEFIKACDICQKIKPGPPPAKPPMMITDTAQQPIEKLAMDTVGPLAETSNEMRFIISLQDNLTRFLWLKAVKDHTANTVAVVLSEFCLLFAIPKIILTDQGTEFCSDIMNNLAKELQIRKIMCTSYHPEPNGALEKTYGTIKSNLKAYVNKEKTDWDVFPPFATSWYNNSWHESLGYSPFQILYGFEPPLPSETEEDKITSLKSYEPAFNQLEPFIVRANLKDFDTTILIDIKHIEEQFHNLFTTVESIRVKRGIIDGIGIASKWLFGTMDSDDAEQIDQKIQNFTSSNTAMQDLISHQIKLVNSSINNFEANNRIFERNNDRIQVLLKTIKNDLISNNQTRAIENFYNTYELFQNQRVHVQAEIETLQSTISFAKRDILHPAVLTPEGLMRILKSATLPLQRTFPISLNSNIAERYADLSIIHTKIKGNHLLFCISIPLVKETEYSLHSIIPLPSPNPSNPQIFNFISTKFSYLLINPLCTEYDLFDKECRPITTEIYLCESTKMSKITHPPKICELQLYLGYAASSFKVDTFHAVVDIWHPLSTNEWLFSTAPAEATIGDHIFYGSSVYNRSLEFKVFNDLSIPIPEIPTALDPIPSVTFEHLDIKGFQQLHKDLKLQQHRLNVMKAAPNQPTFNTIFSGISIFWIITGGVASYSFADS